MSLLGNMQTVAGLTSQDDIDKYFDENWVAKLEYLDEDSGQSDRVCKIDRVLRVFDNLYLNESGEAESVQGKMRIAIVGPGDSSGLDVRYLVKKHLDKSRFATVTEVRDRTDYSTTVLLHRFNQNSNALPSSRKSSIGSSETSGS